MKMIRYLKKKDLTSLFELNNNINNHFDNREYFIRALTEKKIIGHFDENNLIGFLIFNIIWGEVYLLEIIRIDKNHRNQNIASNLVDYFIRKEKPKNLLSSCDESNIISINFHKKLNFKETGKINIDNSQELFFIKDFK